MYQWIWVQYTETVVRSPLRVHAQWHSEAQQPLYVTPPAQPDVDHAPDSPASPGRPARLAASPNGGGDQKHTAEDADRSFFSSAFSVDSNYFPPPRASATAAQLHQSQSVTATAAGAAATRPSSAQWPGVRIPVKAQPGSKTTQDKSTADHLAREGSSHAGPGEALLSLHHVLGYTPSSSTHLLWCPDGVHAVWPCSDVIIGNAFTFFCAMALCCPRTRSHVRTILMLKTCGAACLFFDQS